MAAGWPRAGMERVVAEMGLGVVVRALSIEQRPAPPGVEIAVKDQEGFGSMVPGTTLFRRGKAGYSESPCGVLMSMTMSTASVISTLTSRSTTISTSVSTAGVSVWSSASKNLFTGGRVRQIRRHGHSLEGPCFQDFTFHRFRVHWGASFLVAGVTCFVGLKPRS